MSKNRIAASQFIMYFCFKMYVEKNIVVEMGEVKDFLSQLSKESDQLDFHWYISEDDGYIIYKGG